tara:strand:+ start:76 stop:432 length:357 start_codon:yes stop_codon:yes gene_type:complete
MAKEKFEIIKEADLQNNCPECFNQELKLSFYQKHKYGRLYHRITGEVTHQIYCGKCGSRIYPGQWTDDIERIFNYYEKMVAPEKPATRFTGLFYAIVLFGIVLIGAIVYLFLEGIIAI